MLSLKLLLLLLAIDKPTFAELKTGDVIQLTSQDRVLASPQSVATPAPAPVAAPVVQYGDPYGFGVWLNGERARRGLHPLAHDPSLSQAAAVNSSRGFGHSYMGHSRRQNAGVGHGSQVWPMWTASPAHADALFDRTATHYGISQVGSVWTYNAY